MIGIRVLIDIEVTDALELQIVKRLGKFIAAQKSPISIEIGLCDNECRGLLLVGIGHCGVNVHHVVVLLQLLLQLLYCFALLGCELLGVGRDTYALT